MVIARQQGNVGGGSTATQSTSSMTISAFTGLGSSMCRDVQDITVPVASVTQTEFNRLLQNLGDQPQERELTTIESRFFLSAVSTSSTFTSSVSASTLAVANSSLRSTSVPSTTVSSSVLPASVPSNPGTSGQEMSEEQSEDILSDLFFNSQAF